MSDTASASQQGLPSNHQHHPSSLEENSAPSQADYIRTSAQNYISRSAHILGAPYVHTKGKSILQANVTLHGDYGAPIHIGRYCYIEEGVVIMPTVVPASSDPTLSPVDNIRFSLPSLSAKSTNISEIVAASSPPSTNYQKACPLIIGSHTQIGSNSLIQSISVGSSVRIGSNCILSPRSVIKDCCIIDANTVIPPDMVVPPFSRVRGNPGMIVGCLPECCGGEFVEGCVQDYVRFVRVLEEDGR